MVCVFQKVLEVRPSKVRHGAQPGEETAIRNLLEVALADVLQTNDHYFRKQHIQVHTKCEYHLHGTCMGAGRGGNWQGGHVNPPPLGKYILILTIDRPTF